MIDIAIVGSEEAAKYIDLDNLLLQGITETSFILTFDGTVSAKPYIGTTSLLFNKLFKGDLGKIINFTTNHPEIYGDNLRLKLVGLFDNAVHTSIYIEDGIAGNGNVYKFIDVYNNNEVVYIPELTLDENSIVREDKNTLYKVTCTTPEDVDIFLRHIRSTGLEYTKL